MRLRLTTIDEVNLPRLWQRWQTLQNLRVKASQWREGGILSQTNCMLKQLIRALAVYNSVRVVGPAVDVRKYGRLCKYHSLVCSGSAR